MTTTKILFTSDEEAEKAGYIRLSDLYYTSDEFEEIDDICETSDGHIIRDDDSIYTVDNEVYHESDNGSYFYADDAEEYYSNSYDYYMVETRNGTQRWVSNDDAIFCEDDSTYYEMNYFYSRDGRYDEDSGNYTFEPEESKLLDGYHSGGDVDNSKESDNLRFGIELEKAVICGDEDEHSDYKEAGWKCEEDASVEAEYISPILSLDNYEESIQWMMSTGKDIVNGRIDSHCGGHIHVSSRKVDTQQRLWRKIRLFMPMFWALYPERALNSYCGKNLKKIGEYDSRTNRMSDCNFSQNTCEIRIFPGCNSENTLRFRIRLLHLIVSKAESWALADIKNGIQITSSSSEKANKKSAGSFKEAIEFIRTSRELMEILGLVYNTVEKIDTLVSRIIPAFNEAIYSQDESYEMQNAGQFASKLKTFVANEKYESIQP